jgi:hypothetical protein
MENSVNRALKPTRTHSNACCAQNNCTARTLLPPIVRGIRESGESYSQQQFIFFVPRSEPLIHPEESV